MKSEKIKVLLLVAEAWRDDSAGGNTINNLFKNMNAEFAQVYCSADLPQNDVCEHYFQMTDGMAVKSFFNGKPIYKILNIHNITEAEQSIEHRERKKLKFFKRFRLNIFLFAKSIIWIFCNWKTEELRNFILDFDPDVIFAPCYAFPFQLALTRYVAELTHKKIVTYSGDDSYSLKQISISLFFWINRFWNRQCLRKTYPYYDVFYSMSEDEIHEMSPIVGKQMKILRKGVVVTSYDDTRGIHSPIKMIYAGGIYIERWKVLVEIGKALRNINKDGIKIRLDIYTANSLSLKQKRLLNDGKNIFVHNVVGKEELDELYHDSDIALHCESFSLKNRLTTRLSFSTKIIDCIASGCAVMAIAWKEQTGLKYLKSHDAAICITNVKKIENVLRDIVTNPDLLKKYAENAYNCGVRNHDIIRIQEELFNEFLQLM